MQSSKLYITPYNLLEHELDQCDNPDCEGDCKVSNLHCSPENHYILEEFMYARLTYNRYVKFLTLSEDKKKKMADPAYALKYEEIRKNKLSDLVSDFCRIKSIAGAIYNVQLTVEDAEVPGFPKIINDDEFIFIMTALDTTFFPLYIDACDDDKAIMRLYFRA